MPATTNATASDAATAYEAIVIGGSAGALDALSLVLPALPASLRASVLVVLHLPRDRRSLLGQLFGPRCALPVREVQDQQWLEPGCLYFAPADYHLLVDSGPRLALSLDAPWHFSRPSIDVLFESAADCYGERLLAVLLSGANEDGAQGMASVHAAGGLTVVQAPDSAGCRPCRGRPWPACHRPGCWRRRALPPSSHRCTARGGFECPFIALPPDKIPRENPCPKQIASNA